MCQICVLVLVNILKNVYICIHVFLTTKIYIFSTENQAKNIFFREYQAARAWLRLKLFMSSFQGSAWLKGKCAELTLGYTWNILIWARIQHHLFCWLWIFKRRLGTVIKAYYFLRPDSQYWDLILNVCWRYFWLQALKKNNKNSQQFGLSFKWEISKFSFTI